MKLVFSWDDGALEDQKLFELHEKHEIPGIFFVPTKNREGRAVLTPEMIKKAESKYVSFGGHTKNHVYLTDIPLEEVEEEILENKKYLENILEHEINDFCLPGGKYNDEIVKIIYKHFKTIRTADTMNFKYHDGLLKPAFHMYNRGIKSLVGNAIRNKSYSEAVYIMAHCNKDYFSLIKGLIEKKKNTEDVIVIWGHSWEIEDFNLWDNVEMLFALVRSQKLTVKYGEIFNV